MKFRDKHLKEIYSFLLNDDFYDLDNYIIDNGINDLYEINQSLTGAFAEAVRVKQLDQVTFNYLQQLFNVDLCDEKKVIYPYCSLISLGKCYEKVNVSQQQEIDSIFKSAMNHENSQIRGAVIHATNSIAKKNYKMMLDKFKERIDVASLLEKQVMVACIAQPELLECEEQASKAISIFENLLKDYSKNYDLYRFSVEEIDIYTNELKNSPYNIVLAQPEKTLKVFEKYLKNGDEKINGIIKELLLKYSKSEKSKKAEKLIEKYL